MEKEKRSSNYFGSFLDTMVESPDQERETTASPMKLLEVLEQNGPQSVPALQTTLGLDLITFSKAVENLTEAKLIHVTGPPSDEVVSLTAEGHTLARMQTSPPS